jgi:hypothetical protein
MSVPFEIQKIDGIIDLRSSKLEHWSYNIGVIQLLKKLQPNGILNIILSSDSSCLLEIIGIKSTSRHDIALTEIRSINLFIRELYSVILLLRYGWVSKSLLVLHAHPISLFISFLLLRIIGCRLTVCLHNDIVRSFRTDGFEEIVERILWRVLLSRCSGINFSVLNKYFKRYLLKIGATSPICILRHPTLKREDYTKVANRSKIEMSKFSIGFFGQALPERGLDRFLELVDTTPLCYFVIAGSKTARIAPRKNLKIYEMPSTEDFCRILLYTDAMFIDLSGDNYRIGESGTYWDAVGLSMSFIVGNVTPLFKYRLLANENVSFLEMTYI